MRPRPDDQALRDIRMLLTDVDGILTDGHIHFDGAGVEIKTFHVHDGAGLVYWHRCGGKSGFVSGRGSDVVRKRAEELKVEEIHLGKLDKLPVVEDILARHDLTPANIAYIGDDLADLPVLRIAGFAATVPEARPEVLSAVHYVTETRAGRGAVRELVEVLLKAQGHWDDIVGRSGLP